MNRRGIHQAFGKEAELIRQFFTQTIAFFA